MIVAFDTTTREIYNRTYPRLFVRRTRHIELAGLQLTFASARAGDLEVDQLHIYVTYMAPQTFVSGR